MADERRSKTLKAYRDFNSFQEHISTYNDNNLKCFAVSKAEQNPLWLGDHDPSQAFDVKAILGRASGTISPKALLLLQHVERDHVTFAHFL